VALFCGISPKEYVGVWDVTSKKQLLSLDSVQLGGTPDYREDLQPFSVDGKRLAVLCRKIDSDTQQDSYDLRVFDINRARQESVITLEREQRIWSCAFSPDGRFLAGVGSDSLSGAATVWVWDLTTGQLHASFERGGNRFAVVEFSPGGDYLAVGKSLALNETQGEIVLWNLSSQQMVHIMHGHARGIDDLAFTPDGQYLASIASQPTRNTGEIKLWDMASGQERLSLRVPDVQLATLAFQKNGQRLIAATLNRINDGTLRTWDATPLPIKLEADDLIRRVSSNTGLGGWTHDDIRERISDMKNLAVDLRQAALAQLESLPESSHALNNRSWLVVQRPGHPSEFYRQALVDARRALELAPYDFHILNTLGLAQYRVGDFAEAKGTLARSLALQGDLRGRESPVNLAFLAMTCHQLGEREEALDYLQRLRKCMSDSKFGIYLENRMIRKEAEELIASPGKNAP
jgi:hypothetical protein